MSVPLILWWTGTGLLVGAGLAVYSRRLLTSASAGLLTMRLPAPLLTAIVFGVLAWRFDYRFDLLPYSVLAAVGVALGLIDAIEQRLPSVLVYSGTVLVGALLATSAVLNSGGPDFLRALVGMTILAMFYLVLALIFAGALGAGDVKLACLLGLSLGWQSWSALITATFLGWLTAALAWLILCLARRRRRDSTLPMGPFLLIATLATILMT